jgi:hypothetical protein
MTVFGMSSSSFVTRRGRRIFASAIVALLSCAFVAFAATISPADDLDLPDLVSDDVGNPVYDEQIVDGRLRRLVRFDGYVHNAGSHAFQVTGTRPPDSDWEDGMTSISQTGAGPLDRATMRYESSDGHNHWHIGRAAEYSLIDRPGGVAVAPSQKVGFCLLDSYESPRVVDPAPRIPWEQNHQCESPTYGGTGTAATSLTMTLSAGWRDFYGSDVWLQWVDVSAVLPGRYHLRSQADPDELFKESDENNPPADGMPVTLEGYNAKPVSATNLPRSGASTITLAADKVDDPDLDGTIGPVEYRIDEAPKHGTIDRRVGDWFTGSAVAYTPDADAPKDGRDELRFSARIADDPFPTAPAQATASIAIQPIPVITNAPAALLQGDSVDLDATVPGTTWSVLSGPAAIDAATGVLTADADGLGAVKVRATAGPGRYDETTIQVVDHPPLVITGAPATLYPTQTAELAVAGGGAADWSASAGSITSAGRYTAPSTAVGEVTIRATRGSAEGETTIVVVPPPPVTIVDAPPALVAGTAVQLRATGGPVAWETDLGTVDPDSGLFTAPTAAGGTATVRIRGAYGATDAVRIRITPAPAPQPIPGGDPALLTPASPKTDMTQVVPKGSAPSSKKQRRGPAPTFDKLGAKLSGPYVTVSLRTGRSGKVRMSLVRGKRWLKSCNVTARKGRAISCRLKVKGSRRDLRIVATFRATGRKPLVKRMAVKGSRRTLRR